MKPLSAQRIVPGLNVLHNGIVFHVVEIVNPSQLIAESDDGQRCVLETGTVTLEAPSAAASSVPDLAKINEKHWAEALHIYENIRPLIDMGFRNRTRADVQEVADKLKKHVTTIYRFLDAYEETGLVSSLLRKKRSDKGVARLAPETEAIIQA